VRQPRQVGRRRGPLRAGTTPARRQTTPARRQGGICLARGQFSPSAVRLFMILGHWWRYSPLLTHDHERHTCGGYQRMPVPSGPSRAWYATRLNFVRFVDYEGMATMPSSQRFVARQLVQAGVLHNRSSLIVRNSGFTGCRSVSLQVNGHGSRCCCVALKHGPHRYDVAIGRFERRLLLTIPAKPR
jgi:hypothetical protein